MIDNILLWIAIPILIICILSFILFFFLFRITLRKYFAQSLFSQLKLELLLSCLIHQITMLPLFTKSHTNSSIVFCCNIFVFLNFMSTTASLMLGIAIPSVVYLMIKTPEKAETNKTKYHCIVSSIIWGASITISI